MKRDDLGLANELSLIGQKIYAVGSLIGSKTDCDSIQRKPAKEFF